MKANYLPRNRTGRLYLRRIFIIIAIFAAGAFFFRFFGAAVILAVSPVWKMENVVIRNLRNGIAFFNSQRTLVAENAALKEKLSSLEMEILSLSGRRNQEDVLLELAGRKRESGALIAAVLTRPPQTPYDIIIVDAGSDESIVVGSKVSLPEGPVLGVVSEVFPKQAKVKLFSGAGEKTDAILERGGVPVTLVGAGAGNFRLILPRDMAVEKGDRILFPGIDARLLAIVEETSVRPTDSFREVLARSPANIFVLRFVFITLR